MRKIIVYDTTLRDGSQGEKINFSVLDKIRVTQKLDQLGVHYIEGGWPGSNPKDVEFFQQAQGIELETARITAFGSTRRPKIHPKDDPNIKALVSSGAKVVTIFGKTWDLHVKKVMSNTMKENLAMISDSVLFLCSHGLEVLYDAEHFFDGYKSNSEYAIQTLEAAVKAGAKAIVLCDTNGGMLQFEVSEIMEQVVPHIPVAIGIHTHNDGGLAVANTLAAVMAGAVMVQGTINGFGERCGNADLTTIIPNLQLKMGLDCIPSENIRHLTEISRYISEIANVPPFHGRPFVGKSAFAHKGGVHVAAVMKTPKAYEHIDPEIVGNNRRVLVSDLSGKSNVAYKAKEFGIELGNDESHTKKIVEEVKRLEYEGYQFEAAEASFELLTKKLAGQFDPPFKLESFRVMTEKNKDLPSKAYATIKISVGDEEEITAAEGNGPVNALDNALRKALNKFYRTGLENMRLVDFKVRVIDGRDATAAKVRVFIESRDKGVTWSTVGVAEDVLLASWEALVDSFVYRLCNTWKGESQKSEERQCKSRD
ncbi:MAG: citramalate synthase [Pseudomonadota bacterium]